ncbi:flagellar associated protein [Monoraphidium neglectum]|uniref:Flagellar associated protein n=1 Tax=Monoraphidium neglectum TaxID=145388 RepID=A0A0D2M9K3_9CHLO|nr:flagellar associated protein [Monoraphidium neglectum]KIY97646.1 flagellar associated protein [Monoraphidium neglectum]|eukprot:XP_013896666.1 flagellar associated protein [Monoraphidium neglectum]
MMALEQQHGYGSDSGLPFPDSTPRTRLGSAGGGARMSGAAAAALALSPRSSAGSRPMSALRDLRGSRPNSAAVAAQIEGFDVDFLEVHPLHDVPEGGSDDDSTDGPATARAGRPACADELLPRAQAERRRLLDENGALQRRVRGVLEERAKGRAAATKDMAHLEGAEARYRGALKQWCDLQEERRRVEAHYSSTVFDMKVKLEARIRRAEEIAGTFADFKRQVALSARFARSGRPLGDAALQQLEQRGGRRALDVRRRLAVTGVRIARVLGVAL